MASDITVGLFSICGVLIGGGATVLTNLINLQTQQRQNSEARKQALLDRRYEAHLAYLNGANLFIDDTRELWWALLYSYPPDRRQKVHDDYMNAWQTYFESKGAAQLAGPPDLVVGLSALDKSISDLANLIDGWYRTENASPQSLKDSDVKYTKQQNEVDAKRQQYLEQAQRQFEYLQPGRSFIRGSRSPLRQ